MNVEKLSSRCYLSSDIKELIQEKNSMNAVNVGRASPRIQLSVYIRKSTLATTVCMQWMWEGLHPEINTPACTRESIQGRSLMCVLNVVRLSEGAPDCTSEVTLERSLGSVTAVGNLFHFQVTTWYTSSNHTGEKPYECSDCGRPLPKSHTSTYTRRIHTGERHHVCSECEEGLQPEVQSSACISEFTLERSLTNAVTVGKAFTSKSQFREHVGSTGEKPYVCAACGRLSMVDQISINIRWLTIEREPLPVTSVGPLSSRNQS